MMDVYFMTVVATIFGVFFAIAFYCLVQAILYLQRTKAEVEQAIFTLRSEVTNLMPDEHKDRIYRHQSLQFLATLSKGGAVVITDGEMRFKTPSKQPSTRVPH